MRDKSSSWRKCSRDSGTPKPCLGEELFEALSVGQFLGEGLLEVSLLSLQAGLFALKFGHLRL